MSIPDYESIMLPLLKTLSGGKEMSLREHIDEMAKYYNLTEDERKVLIPSGRSYMFDGRVSWARTYMKQAGLLESPRRGYVKITNEGKKVLNQNIEKINRKFLLQFPTFVEFQERKGTRKKVSEKTEVVLSTETPEEQLDLAYSLIRDDLSSELLNRVKQSSPSFFEKLVVELLLKMGYGGSRKEAGKAIGQSGDEGIDGIIDEDRLGLDTIYIQAKKWENSISRPEIQKFVGALQGKRAKKGIFITTSVFTKEASRYVENIENKVVLIDGSRLTDLMIDFNVGVSLQSNYELKKIDDDYFTT
jgi:restriction system protein|tara:strand:+ start:159 stop:1067 length:909 start_codon:yes stop_codon:yes gene_type:complete